MQKGANDVKYGVQSAVAPLRQCLLRRPSWNPHLEEDWQGTWGYERKPDLRAAQVEHDHFADILRDYGVEVHYLEGEAEGLYDSIFACDRAIVTGKGAVVLRSGKPVRQGEDDLMEAGLRQLDIPVVYRMEQPMTADGGDFLWLREDLVLVGYSYRTNAVAHEEFTRLMDGLGVEVVRMPVPYWSGTGDVMHLTSMINMVDYDLAVAYRKVMAVETVEYLKRQGVQFIDAADEEFDMGLGTNVLAVAPRRCVMLKDYPGVRKDLEAAGVEVRVFGAEQIAHCMKGGATCLTLSTLRMH